MNKLTGLVLSGGQSSRMTTDKSLLIYHEQPQRYYLYEMLSSICNEVFISCNASQATCQPERLETILPGFNYIIDNEKYKHIGPMAALLSAFDQFPGHSFLVIACDYPFLKLEDIEKLKSGREEKQKAIAFFNSESGFYEPLLAVYENDCYSLLQQQYNSGNYSLQHFLKEVNAKKILPSNTQSIKSVDTVEEYERALNKIKSEGPND